MTETVILVCKILIFPAGIAWIIAAVAGMVWYEDKGYIPETLFKIFNRCLWAAVILTIIKFTAEVMK